MLSGNLLLPKRVHENTTLHHYPTGACNLSGLLNASYRQQQDVRPSHATKSALTTITLED